MIEPEPVRIRPATPEEAGPILKRLGLPLEGPYTLVAGLPEKRLIAGSVVMWPPLGKVLHPGFRFVLNVAPAYRGREIGSGLMDALIAEARERGASGLFNKIPVEPGRASAFLERFGFKPVRKKFFFTCPLKAVYERIDPLAERLEARRGVLGGARLLALKDSDKEAAARLYVENLGNLGVPVKRLFYGRGALAFDPLSPVLALGERVIAAMLFRRRGDAALADAYVVRQDFRGTRAALMVLKAAVDAVKPLGLARLDFNCYEDVEDTLRLAACMDARRYFCQAHYFLDLESAGE